MGDHMQDTPTTNTTNSVALTQRDQLVSVKASHFQPGRQDATDNDCDLWRDYWRTQNQAWRAEPEIDVKRQAMLDQYRRATTHNSEQVRYPFKNTASKLDRADIEWLLATHEGGAVNWSDIHQRERVGLDLRGADLHKLRLGGLPLARMRGGLIADEWMLATDHQRDTAAIHLEGADLCGAHLEGADLCGAHLEGADLHGAHLAGAKLREAHLEGTNLSEVHLEGNENFPKPADLRMAFFDSTTNLTGISLGDETYGFVPLADVRWGNANLAVVDWTQVHKLGDEYEAQWKLPIEYQAAIRANRQLAAVLRAQGLSEDAAHFAYRANVNKRFMRPQQALLPVVLRIFVRERMPLPKVLLRLEERRHGQRMSRHPLTSALLRLLPLLLGLVLLAQLSPLALLSLLGLCTAAMLAVLAVLRKRGPQPPQYRHPHRQLPPPGLLSQEQRRRQQWHLLLGFLLGTPKSRLPLLMRPPAEALQHTPLLGRLSKRWQAHSLPVSILASLLLLLLLFDDTLVCYGRYVFSFILSVLTGCGHKPARIFSWYLAVVFSFAALYNIFGHLAPLEALAFSLASFHGRGFFPGNTINPAAMPATTEAVMGLFIEICFIATSIWRFTQR